MPTLFKASKLKNIYLPNSAAALYDPVFKLDLSSHHKAAKQLIFSGMQEFVLG